MYSNSPCLRGAMVSAWVILSSCDAVEHVPYAFRRIRRNSIQISLYSAIRIWLFDFSGQSISLPSFSRRRKIQDCSLDRDWVTDRCALVPWKPWGLAIFVSLCHHPPSLDVSLTGRQRPSEYIRYRDFTIYRLCINYRSFDVSISFYHLDSLI